MILLGGFGRSARTRGWAVLDGLRSIELIYVLMKFFVWLFKLLVTLANPISKIDM